jgi:hypothetical protein
MARSAQSVGVLRGSFAVYDSLNSPVTGLTNGDFTKLAAKDGADDPVAITIAEIGSGRYTYTFNATAGYWFILIRHATHAPRGFQDEYDVS